MLYQVLFQDGTTYKGGNSYKETLWNSMPIDNPIKRIAFALPDGNLIVLQDYEAYNHFCEATRDVCGKGINPKPVLRYQYLMGRKGNKVISYRITLFEGKNNKYRLGDLTRREYEFGKEYNNQPTKGWKRGIIK